MRWRPCGATTARACSAAPDLSCTNPVPPQITFPTSRFKNETVPLSTAGKYVCPQKVDFEDFVLNNTENVKKIKFSHLFPCHFCVLWTQKKNIHDVAGGGGVDLGVFPRRHDVVPWVVLPSFVLDFEPLGIKGTAGGEFFF